MKQRKYKPGPEISTMVDLCHVLGRQEWVYLHKRPVHPSFLRNMSFNTLQAMTQRRVLRRTLENKEGV